MAHVTTFSFTALPGKRQDILDAFQQWEAQEKARSVGFQRSVLVNSNANPDQFTAVVFWDTTENYNRNSERPETDAWYRRLRANLVADPQWFDGTVVAEASA